MRKSLVRAGIVLGLSGVMTFNTLAMTFKDVPANHWAYTSIQYMQENGYMVASSTGEFKPNVQMDYFDLAEVLAKTAGYQDELIIKDMDETLKTQIRKNFEVQKPKIDKYSSKHKAWRNSANEEIAYLLGKGYLTEAELANFVSVDKDGKESKNIVKKEDLAVFLVRILHKEETAKKEYKAGAFSDESKIATSKRPHVAYLKSVGLINGDANGAFGAGAPVTRALASKMTTDVLKYKDKQNGNTETKPGTSNDMIAVTIDKIMDKNETEKYILLKFADNKTSFYTIKENAEVVASTGTKLSVDMIANGATAKVKTEKINGADYVTKVELIKNGTGTTTPPTTTPPTTTPPTTTPPTTTPPTTEKPDPTPDSNESVVTGKSLVEKMERRSEYILVLEDKSGKKEISVPKDARIRRNKKSVDFIDLKQGDKIDLTMENGKVIRVDATSEEQSISGTIQSILIAAKPEVTVLTDEGPVTVIVTPGADLYDKKDRSDISVHELMIYSEVEVELDSKEVVSLTVTKHPGKTIEKGTIKTVGDGGRYIDVLIEYDKLTDTTMVMKRVNIPGSVSIQIDGKEQYRNLLKEGMEVLVTYDYSKGMNPQKVEVLR